MRSGRKWNLPATCVQRLKGRDNLQLRDEILIAQLDVLTNTWRSLPQIIKEDVGES